MEKLHFDNYKNFIREIVNKFNSLTDEFGDVSMVAKYDEAKEIIKELICTGYSIESVDIHRPNYDNYYDEYLISLNFDGIWCEPMKRDGQYFDDDSEVIFIMDNCSSKVIPHCNSERMYEVNIKSINDMDEYEIEMSDETLVEFSEDKTGDMHGFNVSKSDENGYCSYSFYTSDVLTKEDINNVLKNFGF